MERSSLPEADKPPSNVTALWGATWRNSLRLARNSASLVSALVIPGMFMLAFWGVFGHAAGRSGFDYALYLMAASMFQAVMFAAGGSAMALAVDVEARRWHWRSMWNPVFWDACAPCLFTPW